MNKKLKLALIAIPFLLFSGYLFAQNAQELRQGVPVRGYLDSEEEIWFSIRPTEGGFAVIETQGDLDTKLIAYDEQNKILGVDDDEGEGYNARLEVFVASGRTYRIKLSGYDENDTGPFSISVDYMPVPKATALLFDRPQSGFLSPGENLWFSINSRQAGLVLIETTGDLDTVLDLYDSDYNRIASDDDSGEEYNAQIEMFVEPNQTYIFRLKCYDSDESGRYSISADFSLIPEDIERNTDSSRSVTIRLGEGFPVFFHTESESRWFRYDLTRAATFIVQTRGNMDTQLSLYDNRLNLIAEDDDSGEKENALISEKLNPGTYFIEITTYADEIGRCSLHAEIR